METTMLLQQHSSPITEKSIDGNPLLLYAFGKETRKASKHRPPFLHVKRTTTIGAIRIWVSQKSTRRGKEVTLWFAYWREKEQQCYFRSRPTKMALPIAVLIWPLPLSTSCVVCLSGVALFNFLTQLYFWQEAARQTTQLPTATLQTVWEKEAVR